MISGREKSNRLDMSNGRASTGDEMEALEREPFSVVAKQSLMVGAGTGRLGFFLDKVFLS